MENELKPINLGEIEFPKIDVSHYIGKNAKIELVQECESKYGYCVKIQTEIIDKIDFGGKTIELRGNRVFGLYKNKEGKIGWGKDTKLGAFLSKMSVKHYKELKNKEVIIQAMTGKEGKEFLSFN